MFSMKKVVGIIPARWQSSRFPGKPLAEILGKSLIQRTYENAACCKCLDSLAIATDDARIFQHAETFGAQAFMTSPSCATGTDRVWEVIERYFPEAEIIVNIQGDEPCLDPAVIDALVEQLQTNPEAMMTTPVSLMDDETQVFQPNTVKCVFDCQGRALYFSRSPIPYAQKFKAQYFRHIGIYCFRRETLRRFVSLETTLLQACEDLEQLKMLENGVAIHVCKVHDQARGVDTPEDLKLVEELLCQKENMSLSLAALSPL